MVIFVLKIEQPPSIVCRYFILNRQKPVYKKQHLLLYGQCPTKSSVQLLPRRPHGHFNRIFSCVIKKSRAFARKTAKQNFQKKKIAAKGTSFAAMNLKTQEKSSRPVRGAKRPCGIYSALP
ncbi:MAG: hypothetical protein RSC90_10495 [Clostridia bacterium]